VKVASANTRIAIHHLTALLEALLLPRELVIGSKLTPLLEAMRSHDQGRGGINRKVVAQVRQFFTTDGYDVSLRGCGSRDERARIAIVAIARRQAAVGACCCNHTNTSLPYFLS
jgi:hypothetical protein